MPATTKPVKTVTRASDPDAAALADAAQKVARAAGLKSAYTPGEARGVLKAFKVASARGVLTVTRGREDHTVKAAALRALVAGEKDADAAKLMADLSAGLPGTMYGRKTAAFLLALAKR